MIVRADTDRWGRILVCCRVLWICGLFAAGHYSAQCGLPCHYSVVTQCLYAPAYEWVSVCVLVYAFVHMSDCKHQFSGHASMSMCLQDYVIYQGCQEEVQIRPLTSDQLTALYTHKHSHFCTSVLVRTLFDIKHSTITLTITTTCTPHVLPWKNKSCLIQFELNMSCIFFIS